MATNLMFGKQPF